MEFNTDDNFHLRHKRVAWLNTAFTIALQDMGVSGLTIKSKWTHTY